MGISSDMWEISSDGVLCDVCRVKNARYYNVTWYIHVCSKECFDIFTQKFNEEIDNFVITRLKPDETEGFSDNEM